MHIAATYSRSIEATFRGYAFNATTDMEYLRTQVNPATSAWADRYPPSLPLLVAPSVSEVTALLQ